MYLAMVFSSTTCERWLHRLERREETDLAAGHLRSELRAQLTEQLAGDRARRNDRLHEVVADVCSVLDERAGVPVALEDHALGLVVVEVGLVLQRSSVLRTHDLHALSGQALELFELALVDLEASDPLKLTRGHLVPGHGPLLA